MGAEKALINAERAIRVGASFPFAEKSWWK